jgi:hypothetical protein
MEKKLPHFTLLLLCMSVVACGERSRGNPEPITETSSLPIIVGDLDWKDVSNLDPTHAVRKNADAVGDVSLPVMGSRCTGFLVAENVVMTNQHCVPSAFYAQGVKVSFKHEEGVDKKDWKTYDCSEFIGNDNKHDYALLKCQGMPGKEFGVVTFSDKIDMDKIYIIQQNCDYYNNANCDWSKKVSYGDVLGTKTNWAGGLDIIHNADTLGGSSGSPVFDQDTHKVVALHHAGYGNNGKGRGVENYAVRIKELLVDLNSKFPDILKDQTPSKDPKRVEVEEPNNSQVTATEMSLGQFAESEITSEDHDYFKFKINNDRQVKLLIEFTHQVGDLDMVLMDSQNKVVARGHSVNDNESAETNLKPDLYTLIIYGYRGAQAPYRLSLEAL